jgi:hypothetical protein
VLLTDVLGVNGTSIEIPKQFNFVHKRNDVLVSFILFAVKFKASTLMHYLGKNPAALNPKLRP